MEVYKKMVNIVEMVPLWGWKAMTVLFFTLAMGMMVLGSIKIWRIRKKEQKTR